ncbi:amphoterin-induced protein 1 [Kryptolebias marmoratus]|uniref:Adhesion molecule with Ig like domain 1 n=1 Tax=Kryptolebias marmoratus TaxID=37003 RepID=A0A3Q3BG03_KRYMA|nr:amphoterin-induced protein 1 [Kryptolebias marmoratus]XP_024861605.1 amphoterin-induced protein 1 [Kryptolebias marmoratus]
MVEDAPQRILDMMGALTFRRSVVAVLSLLLAAAKVNGKPKIVPLDCNKTCLCASNIISCSNASLSQVPSPLPSKTAVLDLSFNSITHLYHKWAPENLGSLQSLILRNNGLYFLSTEAFVHVTNLTYLDLSFNNLRQLDELIFEPLERLQVLVLFKNNISQIDRTAFEGLASLQRLYMSHNLISRFPLEVLKDESRLGTFRLFDVSSNRLKTLLLQDLQALGAWIKNGVYFHNNPLTCSCELYVVLAQWRIKELSSVVDFPDNHTCVIPGARQEKMLILDLDRAYLNCTAVKVLKEEAYLEQSIVLDCDTKQRKMEKRWELPENSSLSLVNGTAKILSNGNLRIGPLKAAHSGVYTCYATGDSLNETLHVTVEVFNATARGGLENLKTAYTTLVGCLISVVAVIAYLYFTPCRCPCCPGQGSEKGDPAESLRSSTASIPEAQDRTGRRGAEGGGLPYGPAGLPEENGRLNPIGEEDDEVWQEGDRKRRRSDADSVSSVCSDTPMVV